MMSIQIRIFVEFFLMEARTPGRACAQRNLSLRGGRISDRLQRVERIQECMRCGHLPDIIAIAQGGKRKASCRGMPVVADSDIHCAYGIALRAAAGAGKARGGDGKICPEGARRTFGHGACHLLADHTVLFNERGGYAEQGGLGTRLIGSPARGRSARSA